MVGTQHGTLPEVAPWCSVTYCCMGHDMCWFLRHTTLPSLLQHACTVQQLKNFYFLINWWVLGFVTSKVQCHGI